MATYEIDIDGEIFSVEIEDGEGGILNASVGGVTYQVTLPEGAEVAAPRRRNAGGKSRGKSGTVSTSIPGKIVTLEVSPGDAVTEGQVILILEAMKMQNEVTAPVTGIVSAVNCAEGDNVEANMALVVIEPEATEEKVSE